MRHVILLSLAVFIFSAAVCFADDNMMCGSELVSIGDMKESVLIKCGPPFMKENGTRERWIYNFGSSYFMKILTFDGGRLDSIEDGEKGTDQ